MSVATQKMAAIMQPTYLPWIGYLDLIDRSDVFVFLDSVQFARRSWQQRNRVNAPSGPQWLTVPVLSKGKREQRICEVVIDASSRFAESHLRTIRHLYASAPFFEAYYGPLSDVLRGGYERLVDLNIAVIQWLCAAIGIATPTLRSSTLEAQGRKADLLAEICGTLGAARYLSAEGSREYIQASDAFARRGIEVVYHQYQHPEYRQQGTGFTPYLSSLDLLLNEGPSSLTVIRQGRGTA